MPCLPASVRPSGLQAPCEGWASQRYGVQVKVFGKQMRIGSRFHDVTSAEKVAKAFRMVRRQRMQYLLPPLPPQTTHLLALALSSLLARLITHACSGRPPQRTRFQCFRRRFTVTDSPLNDSAWLTAP